MGVECSKPKESELLNQIPDKEVEIVKLEDLCLFKLPFLTSEVPVNQCIDSNQTIDNYFKMFDEVHMQGRYSYVKVLTKEAALLRYKYSLKDINIFHSDRGNEYDNVPIDDILSAFKINRSLSRRANPYDNAVNESNNKSLR